MRKEYFTQGVVRLFIEVVGSPSMEAFKARLDGILGPDPGEVSLPIEGVGTGWFLRSLPIQTVL